ncbi:mycofactocin-coupled SDR family oxidoreductase [Amycolatopsis sp. GM8]|uniref:mycofactocin-coupled SDR family oxidoreductase n=1 Tax=Amycolatopsis sp. GM8 TaxID=2896530 RepID=UPI001F29D04F|nr:mycofactocin-coupled SDR family oxidoreductase [Amycolatopsis sp. GM8]
MGVDAAGRRFDGKVAFITGAARGQGRAEAVRLAREGADIIAIDICAPLETVTYELATKQDLEETARLVTGLGRRIVAREADVRDLDSLTAAVTDGVTELGRLDVVIANAGITVGGMVWEHTAKMWQETIDVNLTGAFNTIKAALPTMIEQGTGGSIVLTSSVSGLKGSPFHAAYVASKHGLVGLMRAVANEVGQFGIRVNSVHPGTVNTKLRPKEMLGLIDKYRDSLSVGYQNVLPAQASEPEDVANAVAWLSSDEARHITGQTLPVDLGRTIL